MELKKTLTLALILMSLVLSASKSQHLKKPRPQLIIYSLPQLSTYLINIDCGAVERKEDVTVKVISATKDIKKFLALLGDSSNFSFLSNSGSDFDARIHFTCFFKKKQYDICWSKTNTILLRGKIYTYNEEIKKYLVEQKLIIDFK